MSSRLPLVFLSERLKDTLRISNSEMHGFEWRVQLARWKHAFSGMESGSFCAGGVNELSAEVAAVNASVQIPYSESLLNLTE